MKSITHNPHDLRQIVAQVWGEGKKSGRAVLYRARWRTGDDTPSFAIYADGYKDFGGDGESGSTIQWVMREFGYNFREAVTWLENRYNYSNNVTTSSVRQLSQSSQNYTPPSLEWQHLLRAAVRETERLLWSPIGVGALNYLRQERGLTDETIHAAGLGYAPDYVKTDLMYEDESGSTHRLSIPPGIVIPWEVNGVLWAVRVRSRVGALATALDISDDRFSFGDRSGELLDKYRSARGSRTAGVLYGADGIVSDKKVLFFEGEFDALLAGQHLGDKAACVTFGSASNIPSTLPETYAQRLATHDPIYLVMDADKAGQTAGIKLRKLFPKNSVTLALPVEHKDITEYAQSGGNIRDWFANATIKRVPDSWIRGLLHLKDHNGSHQGTAAPVYYVLQQCENAGLLDSKEFTHADILTCAARLGIKMTYDLVRDGVRVLQDNGLLVRSVSEINLNTDHKMTKKTGLRANLKGGRPAEVFSLRSPEESRNALATALTILIREKAFPVKKTPQQVPTVADLDKRAFSDMHIDEGYQSLVEIESVAVKSKQRYERRSAFRRERRLSNILIDTLEDLTATPMPEGWEINTLRLFRIAFLRALKLANRVGSSLDEVATAVGISKGSVNPMVRLAGFDIETNQSVSLALDGDTPVEQQVRNKAMEVGGKPIIIEIEMPAPVGGDASYIAPRISRVPYTTAAAYDALQQGKRVSVCYQTANLHIPRLNVEPLKTLSCSRRRESGTLEKSISHQKDAVVPSQQSKMPIYLELHDDEEGEPRRAGYSPEWFEGQIRLRLELSGFLSKDGKRYISPKSGEIILYDSDVENLILLFIGEPVFM